MERLSAFCLVVAAEESAHESPPVEHTENGAKAEFFVFRLALRPFVPADSPSSGGGADARRGGR
jgi:hypothetical protein